MAEIASWNGHSFTVSPKLIRGFTGLTIKGGSETKDKTSSNQKYVSRKNSIPSEVTMTVELNAFTGCDVQNEALKFVEEARSGAKNYFYMGGKKLITCQLMLTEASVSETTIAPNGTWVSCKVKLTMKQCAKYDSEPSSTKKSSTKKSSTKKKSTTTTKKTTTTTKKTTTKAPVVSEAQAAAARSNTQRKAAHAADMAAKTKGALKTAVAAVNNAKKTSSTTKRTSVVSKVVTSAAKNKVKALLK